MKNLMTFFLMLSAMLAGFKSRAQFGQVIAFYYDGNGDRCVRRFFPEGQLRLNPKDTSEKDTVVIKKDAPIAKGAKDDAKIEVKAYPNPTTDALTIENLTPKADDKVRVMLFTIDGKFISAKNLQTTKDYISMEGLTPGTYQLHYYLNGEVFTVWKIVKL